MSTNALYAEMIDCPIAVHYHDAHYDISLRFCAIEEVTLPPRSGDHDTPPTVWLPPCHQVEGFAATRRSLQGSATVSFLKLFDS